MDRDDQAAIAIIRGLMTKEMAIEGYLAWEVLFNAYYYLETGPLPEKVRGSVDRLLAAY